MGEIEEGIYKCVYYGGFKRELNLHLSQWKSVNNIYPPKKRYFSRISMLLRNTKVNSRRVTR